MTDPDKLKAALKLTPEEVDLEIASAWKSYIAVLTEIKNKHGKQKGRAVATEPSDDETRNLRFARLPLAEVIPEYLASCKEPQTAKQIVAVLVRAGRKFESNNPVHSVRMTLKDLMAKNDDIFHAGWAKWHLKSKYVTKRAKEKLAKLLAGNDRFGTGGKSKTEHSKRTADGIDKRRRETGISWGRAKTSSEVIERAKEMLRDGVTLTEVCRTLKVSTATLYQNGVHQRELKKEGKLRREAELALGDNKEGNNVVHFAKS